MIYWVSLVNMGISVKLRDERNGGRPIDANFLGQLTVDKTKP